MNKYIEREELLKRLYDKLVSTAGYVRREIRYCADGKRKEGDV